MKDSFLIFSDIILKEKTFYFYTCRLSVCIYKQDLQIRNLIVGRKS